MRTTAWLVLLAWFSVTSISASAQPDHPLPSWNDNPAKQSILDFVKAVTTEGSPDFVPEAERIATFDNDGCLWSEQPVYFQLIYAMDRVKQLAPQHPEWATTPPFQAVLEGDKAALAAMDHQQLSQLIAASHAGMTTDAFNQAVRDWLDTARHPRFDRPYDELTYQPMVELLEYLRANGFKTFIVSGGGIDFVRVFSEDAYGIPPEQVVGSSLKIGFEMRDGVPTLVKLPELNFIDDKEGKPVGIHQHIGRRPIFAAGNSDGDLQMLQYTTASGSGKPSFGLLIHHTDAQREWAYDRESHIGKLDAALDEAGPQGWTVVDMAEDWSTVYAADE
ncbi:MAG: HAD family hydrolase [Planctomycetota bacterium]